MAPLVRTCLLVLPLGVTLTSSMYRVLAEREAMIGVSGGPTRVTSARSARNVLDGVPRPERHKNDRSIINFTAQDSHSCERFIAWKSVPPAEIS